MDDVWAVGYWGLTGDYHAFIEHWNGVQWSIVPIPVSGVSDLLFDIAAISPTDIWAVGSFATDTDFAVRTLTLNWDGSTWSVIPSPNLPATQNFLFSISGSSPGTVWAVGDAGFSESWQTLTMRWDGTAWGIVPSPNPGGSNFSKLEGVVAVSGGNVWAVGSYTPDAGVTYPALLEHWNGAEWSHVLSTGGGSDSSTLYDVAASGSGDLWAVGQQNGSSGPPQPLVQRYSDPCAPLLVGHMTWQGMPAQPHLQQQQPVTLTLKLGTTEHNFPVQLTDPSGFFTATVSGLTPGTYNWRIKGPKYLANAGTVYLEGAPVTSLEMNLMRTGDASADNVVGAADFNILRRTFGLSAGQVGYNDRADFTGDRVVGSTDFNLLRSNFGLGGAPPIGPTLP